MIVSTLFMLTLSMEGQVCSASPLQPLQSQSHNSKDRAVIVSTGAGISELPVSEFHALSPQGQSAGQAEHAHLVPLRGGHEVGVKARKIMPALLDASAGDNFAEQPSSELSMSSYQVRKLVRRRKDESLKSAGSSSDGTTSLEISAGAVFSELPISETPLSEVPAPSAQGRQLVQPPEDEHLTPLGNGPTSGAEPYKVDSGLPNAFAEAVFSEMPVSQLPKASSKAVQSVERVDYELGTPLVRGPEDSVEAHKVTSALLQFARENSTSASAIQTLARLLSVDRARLHTSTIFLLIVFVLIPVVLLVVFLAVSLERARQENRRLREDISEGQSESSAQSSNPKGPLVNMTSAANAVRDKNKIVKMLHRAKPSESF